MPCKRHEFYSETCLDCRIVRFGCAYNGVAHKWTKGSDYCAKQECGMPKPSWVQDFETLGWATA